MRDISRRSLLGLGAAAAVAVAGCGEGLTIGSDPPGQEPGPSSTGGGESGGTPRPIEPPVRLIGDGSTADTGKQPHQPEHP